MFPECWLGAEGERRVGTCMPYMYTCRIATGELVVHVYVLVVCATVPKKRWQFAVLYLWITMTTNVLYIVPLHTRTHTHHLNLPVISS